MRFTSLSAQHGIPSARSSSRPTGNPSQFGIVDAPTATPSGKVTAPGSPMPMPQTGEPGTSVRATSRRHESTMAPSTDSGPAWMSISWRSLTSSVPSRSETAAVNPVTPTSTATARPAPALKW